MKQGWEKASHTSWAADHHREASAVPRNDPPPGTQPPGLCVLLQTNNAGFCHNFPPGLKRPRAMLEPRTHFLCPRKLLSTDNKHVPHPHRHQLTAPRQPGDHTAPRCCRGTCPCPRCSPRGRTSHQPLPLLQGRPATLSPEEKRKGRGSRALPGAAAVVCSSYLGRAGWGPAWQLRARL